jgi:hypothetical protein
MTPPERDGYSSLQLPEKTAEAKALIYYARSLIWFIKGAFLFKLSPITIHPEFPQDANKVRGQTDQSVRFHFNLLN